MTDDFRLFTDLADGDGERVDPDIAIIAAYLAGELSPIQVAAVERRLATDADFRSTVGPALDAWSAGGGALTAAQHAEGWQRHLAAMGQRGEGVAAATMEIQPLRASTRPRRIPITRIAATIALVGLPLVGVAQLAAYAATHPDVPGHRLARAVMPASLREPVRPPARRDSPVHDGVEPQALEAWAAAQQAVPIVELSPTAKTGRTLSGPFGVKEAPDGRLLVNDARAKQLLLFDRDLASATVVMDSAPGSATSYGRSAVSPLLPYSGDSSLLVDAGTRTMRVLDAHGRVVRAVAPPPLSLLADAGGMTLWNSLPAGVDGRGRITIQVPRGAGLLPVRVPVSGLLPPSAAAAAAALPGGGGRSGSTDDPGSSTIFSNDRADSVPILRVDFERRRYDTVAFVKQPADARSGRTYPFGGGKIVITYGRDGAPESARQVINPLYAVDEWAAIADGTIGIVRGHDYHVDWIHPDGTRSASPKLPFEWKRLTEEQKQRLVDSTRAYIDSADAALAVTLANRTPRDTVLPAKFAVRSVPYGIVPLSEISDYYPPISLGLNSVLGDRDGNLWILPKSTSLSRKGELVYDIVNEKDGLRRRVRLPVGRSIVGFGKGGVVYLQSGDLKSGFFIERATVPK